ncbi:RagB/SusD family nutrient uptake outer membrane protein [Chitinophaga japonensis]|uniref:Putative outer membrane starch-binding protein n=1 Tax=Chitinophaga japonensis TaxID=104662 RepID=A0A562SZJ3_CHIJA|nr:RagB/SusD family nutrient uptake outer membrane protein [Chitinophaga japonensis]TWI86424.1 putative outer membrane starch-binding protein [Chitinophaga japonensis]
MKHAKKIFAIALTAFTLGAGMSCKKALEEKVYDFKDPEAFYETDQELLLGVNGVYKNLMTWDLWISPAWSAVIGEDDDLLLENWLAGGYSGNQAGQWYIQRPWTGFYYVVQRANLVLKYAAQVSGNAELISRIKGEAHFLRAYCYFELVRRYGDVPLRLEAYDPSQSMDIARSPVADVYAQVVADLQQAADILPETYSGNYSASDRGRPTKAAAMGMLAKVYMHMAGDELKQPQYYARAVAAAQAVVDMANANGYPALETDYMKIFDEPTQHLSNEILFAIPATHSPNQGSELPGYFSPQGFYSGGGSGGFVSVRTDFVNTFEAGDKRVAFGSAIWSAWKDQGGSTFYHISQVPAGAVLTNTGTWGQEYDGGGGYGQNTYTLNGSTIYGSPRYYSLKYTDPNAQAKDENGNDPIILRYADVLLLLAEAENEVNGPTAVAYNAINAVRARAGLAPLSGLDKSAFRQKVRDERRFELYGEFQRRWDLVRWGTWLQTMNDAGRPRQAYQKLYPIAQEEIAGNKLIETNNPGY